MCMESNDSKRNHMSTEREKISEALREISIGSRRNKTARLRECFDEVEAAKAAGASNKTIVAALEANGLYFDVNNFKNARSRILKERALRGKNTTEVSGNLKQSEQLNKEPGKGLISGLNNSTSESTKIAPKPKTFEHNPSPNEEDLL